MMLNGSIDPAAEFLFIRKNSFEDAALFRIKIIKSPFNKWVSLCQPKLIKKNRDHRRDMLVDEFKDQKLIEDARRIVERDRIAKNIIKRDKLRHRENRFKVLEKPCETDTEIDYTEFSESSTDF